MYNVNRENPVIYRVQYVKKVRLVKNISINLTRKIAHLITESIL